MESLLVDVPSAAKLLNLTEQRCYALVRSGKIPSLKLGRRTLRISTDALRQWCLDNSALNGKVSAAPEVAEFYRDVQTGQLRRVGS